MPEQTFKGVIPIRHFAAPLTGSLPAIIVNAGESAAEENRQDLNCAYAFAASPRFIEAATALKDGLVENGFERMEASDLVVSAAQTELALEQAPLFLEVSVSISEPPDVTKLDERLRRKHSYDEVGNRLTINGEIGPLDLAAIQASLAEPEDRAAVAGAAVAGHLRYGIGASGQNSRRSDFRVSGRNDVTGAATLVPGVVYSS